MSENNNKATGDEWRTEQSRSETRYMFRLFRFLTFAPIAYVGSAFILGYFVVLAYQAATEPTNIRMLFGILLTLIISSAAVIITVTVLVTHYWVTMKITQQFGRKGEEEEKKSNMSD